MLKSIIIKSINIYNKRISIIHRPSPIYYITWYLGLGSHSTSMLSAVYLFINVLFVYVNFHFLFFTPHVTLKWSPYHRYRRSYPSPLSMRVLHSIITIILYRILYNYKLMYPLFKEMIWFSYTVCAYISICIYLINLK